MKALVDKLAKQAEENQKELVTLNKTVSNLYKDYTKDKKKEEADKNLIDFEKVYPIAEDA